MQTYFGVLLLLILAVTLSAQSAIPESRIQVFSYNYAAIAPALLSEAENTAAWIYARAGIRANFINCPFGSDEAAQSSPCDAPGGAAVLVLRFLSRPMSERIGLTLPTFGSAIIPHDGGLARFAQVCAGCAEDLAQGDHKLYALILGHAVAHELGHLLLGGGTHSPTGLMHSPWRRVEFLKVAQGSLFFSSQEAGKMRLQISERERATALLLAAAR